MKRIALAVFVASLMLFGISFGQTQPPLIAAAATSGPSALGTVALTAGASLDVTCPNGLTSSGTGSSMSLACAPDSDPTTTTTPPTTTAPPPTTVAAPPTTVTTPPATGCGLTQVAFCDTFDGPTTNGAANSRAGQLDGVLWGTSEETGAPGDPVATAQAGQVNDGASTIACATGAGQVNYPANIQVCGGQLVDTTNDGGTVSSLAMYPRQPFNFAGRTGTIVFDVNDNSQGNHAAWPELWVTDQPVPDPTTHEDTFKSLPKNGFGIRFAKCEVTCSVGENGEGVDSAITVSNYVENDSFNGGNLNVEDTGSVLPSGPGQTNHYEVKVSTSDIEVYATNPFSGTWNPTADPLVHIASIPAANLSFSQGLVWLEDVHYNGDKLGTDQRTNTFTWDNVGFDGPVEPRDLGFDVPADTTPNPNVNVDPSSVVPGRNTAYVVQPNSAVDLTVPGITAADLSAASAGLLEANWYYDGSNPASINVKVNGHEIDTPWPFDATTNSPRTPAIPVPLADLAAGNNTVTFETGAAPLSVSNIDVILAGAGGVIQP